MPTTQGTVPPLRVVIVGRGFAGLSAAIACARQGFEVVLLERGTGQSPHGDNITIGCSAARILFLWGVGEELWDRSARGGWWLLKDAQGRSLSEEDLRDFPSRFDAPLLSGHRAQYLGALGAEARELGVDTRVCTEVVDYLDSTDSPGVLTKNGEVIRGNVVLVADGVNSPGRAILSKKYQNGVPANPEGGYSVHRAAMRSDSIRADPECAHLLDGNIRTWIGKDAHAIIAPLDEGRQISFSVTHHSINGEASTSWRDRKPIQEVLNIIEGWDPALVRAVRCFPSALNWVIREAAPAEEWISDSGKICFIGDAVHSLMPLSFQGGSQAIEGGAAVALALSLAGGRPCDVPLALKVFQAIRRPRVTKAHEMGQKQRRAWHGHHLTQDAEDLPLLATAFYDFDVEAFFIANFQGVASTFDSTFVVEEHAKVNARSKIGLGRGRKVRFEGEKPLC